MSTVKYDHSADFSIRVSRDEHGAYRARFLDNDWYLMEPVWPEWNYQPYAECPGEAIVKFRLGHIPPTAEPPPDPQREVAELSGAADEAEYYFDFSAEGVVTELFRILGDVIEEFFEW